MKNFRSRKYISDKEFSVSTEMKGRAPYGFDAVPIVMDGLKTKRLIETAKGRQEKVY
ncbi:MAG: hypothetical protein HFF69_13345 [Oscillospiraceae bacterium]|nr:hypothetical protein [Oscillospiraceae bacterium]